MLPFWAKGKKAPGSTPRGCGLLGFDEKAPQPFGTKDWDFDLLGLAESRVDRVDLEHLVVSVLDQGKSNTCVAQAWEQAIRMEQVRLGYPVELGSRLFGYSNSRAEHGGQRRDLGTFLRTYAWARKKVGCCPESVWPFVLDRVNQDPPPRAFRQAWAMRGLRGYYKIHDTGAARTAAIRAALVEGKPVVFGTLVDAGFLRGDGPDVAGIPRGKIIGGHAMCFIGFERRDDEFVYKIVQSYGPKWRMGGFCYLTEEFVQWHGLQDIWVVSLR